MKVIGIDFIIGQFDYYLLLVVYGEKYKFINNYIKFIDFKYDINLLLVGLGKFKFIIYVYFLKCLFECFSIYI